MMENDTTNIQLKTKLSDVLDVVTLIAILYSIFIVILGLAVKSSETIIEGCIIFVVFVIFEYLNYDVTKINNKGIKNVRYGDLEWSKIYRVEKKDYTLFLYTKEKNAPYKIVVNRSEDEQEFSRAYKYILSKIKSPDKVKIKENL